MIPQGLIDIAYLAAVLLFILGLKKLSHPDTARQGNLMAASGMIIGIITALVVPIKNSYGNYVWIIAGIAVGTIAGLIAAKKVKMTSMPEMVSLLNGLGGACAMLIAMVEFYNFPEME
ncbi:MAG: NAD(P)(+) transhydrogenase (Re/Si-specific) subunit beta, partial [Cyclobacteriaceae bacterium]